MNIVASYIDFCSFFPDELDHCIVCIGDSVWYDGHAWYHSRNTRQFTLVRWTHLDWSFRALVLKFGLKERYPAIMYLFKVNNKDTRKKWNMFKVNNKDTRATPMTSFCCHYCWLWMYFSYFSTVSIADFELVNSCWAKKNFCLDKSRKELMFQSLSRWRAPSYRNQFIDLLCKSVEWFLCDRYLRHERFKLSFHEKVNVAKVLGSNWYSSIFIPNESKKREGFDQIEITGVIYFRYCKSSVCKWYSLISRLWEWAKALNDFKLNLLSANPTKWSNTLKQFVGVCRQLFECVWPFCGVDVKG